MPKSSKLPSEDWANAFADLTDRFPDDQLLRDFGFEIRYRRKKKPPVWEAPDGSLVDLKEALREVKSGRWKKIV